ncbi:beta-ketoacyl synthase [Streptomyces sp. ISL-11]|uniref:beta-ketoacyl-[acyl-carrier-protein] synthase family protein n=1 Tax=Streptomyces sp. ISL-11 TaxID=2819174 RepID=UPI001BE70A54|nr:beta-ketoacyl-[acyl-carrier-protein] synthase family protein [Streptomyces sp. ISL-11]MBT2384959.1 beta-ketoacyl-[acyl-carrier-protein] synthase family protein [Streptomyces sp. ISL-11]
MKLAQERIAVTGVGLVTPAGVGAARTWEAVCTARSTAATDQNLAGLPVTFSCRVPGLDAAPGPRSWRHDRYTQLALLAASEAVADAGLDPRAWAGTRVAVVLGSAAGGISTYEEQHAKLLRTGPESISPLTLPAFLPNMAAGQLAIELGIRGPSLHTATACASGATALITAAQLLRDDLCDIAIAGAADSMITRLCAAAFAKMGALSRRNEQPESASRPFDTQRDGFVLAEGAGILVLERSADAAARRARPYGMLDGCAATTDAHGVTAPDPEGRGLHRAFELALADADATARHVDHVNAHGTSTLLNDRMEAGVLSRLFAAVAPSVTSAKGALGHTMGAAGAIEAVLAVLTLQHGLVPPIANLCAVDPAARPLDLVSGRARQQTVDLALSASSGFGGHNTVLAFRPAI